jgi:putative nucleotidyltransferase with HDIG domain
MASGLVEVFYFGEIAGDQEPPFLDEERSLIQAISTQIAQLLERRRAEARIQKLSHLYAALSQTNTTIVRSMNRDELFRDICKGAVEYGKFKMAWVGLVDKETRRVNPVWQYGAEPGYLTDIVISADDVPEGRGPTGTAIRENRVSYVNDYFTDERTWPWREAVLKGGFRCGAALPLRFGSDVIGALTLYADEPGFFDADQLSLLEEMAEDISFALDGFERETLRRQAEEGRETALLKLRKALEDSIGVAASISEVRDPYTAGHQLRVSQLAAAIAVEMGLPQYQVEGIRFGSLIHDIGKIGVPAEILSKPSRLTVLEMELIQVHPKVGYEIVKDIEFPWPVAQMILQHHERLDGAGYPAKLKAGEIILEARIIAVASTVSATAMIFASRIISPALSLAG